MKEIKNFKIEELPSYSIIFATTFREGYEEERTIYVYYYLVWERR